MRSWRWYQWKYFKKSISKCYKIPVLLGSIATVAVFGLWQQLIEQEQLHIQAVVQQEADAVGLEINQALSTRILGLERMASRWQASAGTPKAFWELDATHLGEHHDGYQAIAWVDPTLHMQWVVPLNGSETVQNLDLSQEPYRRALLNTARELHQTFLAHTTSLIPEGNGFLVYVPLWVDASDRMPGPDRFDGFIVGIFQFQTFFDSILPAPSNYHIEIYDGTQLIYSRGNGLPAATPIVVSVQADGIDWQIQVSPTSAVLLEARSPLPTIVLWGGLTGAWALALTVYLGQRAERQARRTRTMNRQLQDEMIHRQQVESRLRESEERLSLALEASGEGWWDWDIVTGKVERSPQYLKLLGYETDDFPEVLSAWKNSIHPDDLPKVVAQLDIHIKDGVVPYSCDYRVRTKSGRWQWIADYGKVVTRDPQNQPIRMIGTFKDISDRKHAEVALAESQQRFQNLVENSPDIIERFDLNLRHLYVSPALTQITGVAPEAFLGKTCRELGMDEAMINTWEEAATRLLKTGQKQVIEFQASTLDGVRSFEMAIAPEWSDQRTIESILCLSRDITERYKTEDALRQSEATKQAIIQAIPDLLIRMRSDGGYIEFISNNRFNIINPEQIRQHSNVHHVLPPELAQLRMHYTQQALDSGITQVYEQEILIKGNQCYEEVRIVPLLQDEVLVMVRDITHRKQAETELQHQKEVLQTIVNHIPVMIALFNAEGRIKFVNPEFEKVLGWSLQDWWQRDVLLECYPNPDDYQRAIAHMLSANGQWKDFATLTQTGQKIETSWTNVRLSNGSNLGIGQDISDRKRKEHALQQAMEAAEAANLAKSMFLANMSHELRTPLNVILGFAQVMAHDPSLTPSQKEDLQTIQCSGDHLLSLINDVLDLSKIEAGHFSLEEKGFDLIALLHGLRTMMAERASAKKLQLTFDIGPEVPQFVIADEQKLRQILLNLLGNAIKFTKQGSVVLSVRKQEPSDQNDSILSTPSNASDRQNSRSRSCRLQFDVIDTGVGMAAKEQENIFDAFVQAEAGRKGMSGTGLGLTISRKLLELMNGTIAVNSVLGQGSTFTVVVPVCPTSSVLSQPEQPHRTVIGLAPGQPQYRILVVDDQRENRLLMVRLLTQLGLEVREVVNGQDAIAIWQEWQPDLTWMDIRMPGLNGYETTQQIRAMDQEKTSIIIALTAQASQSDHALALAAGCNDYLSKPFQEETVFLKMAEHLGLKYVYAEPDNGLLPAPTTLFSSVQDLSSRLDPALITHLSEDWLHRLEDAALCGSDRAIAELIAQLSPDFSALGQHLMDLAHQFQFEGILDWVHNSAKEDAHGSSTETCF